MATALVALSRWGLSCSFAGMIGDDLFGRMIRASLAEEGIRTDGLVIREGFLSQFAFIAAEPAQSRRTIFWQRPTGPEIRPDEIDIDAIRQVRVLYTDGLFTTGRDDFNEAFQRLVQIENTCRKEYFQRV